MAFYTLGRCISGFTNKGTYYIHVQGVQKNMWSIYRLCKKIEVVFLLEQYNKPQLLILGFTKCGPPFNKKSFAVFSDSAVLGTKNKKNS